jgi:uncharacterized protein YegP (UPF0339 family)
MRNTSNSDEGEDMAAKFEISSAKAGQCNWVLKSQGRTLATGESYSRRASAEKAIESLRKAAAGATVADLTVKPKAAPSKATKAVKRTTKTAAKAAAAKKPARKAAAARKPAATKKAGAARKRTSKSV